MNAGSDKWREARIENPGEGPTLVSFDKNAADHDVTKAYWKEFYTPVFQGLKISHHNMRYSKFNARLFGKRGMQWLNWW